MSAGTAFRSYDNFCQHCGTAFQVSGDTCSSCGTQVHPTPQALTRTAGRSLTHLEEGECDRHLKVARSCLNDIGGKVEAIRRARIDSDREIKGGTFLESFGAGGRQRELEDEFNECLTIAWNSALKAWEIDPNRHVEIDGIEVTPQLIFGQVNAFHGDLRFVLEEWDSAISFYMQTLHYCPASLPCHYYIGLAYASKHDVALAIESFQQVVQLNPTGYYGIEAAKNIEKLKIRATKGKRFTGSWTVVGILGFLSLLMPKSLPLWGGLLAFYWWLKYK